MLQWMGGSRRKVTSSRRSTQKRQKQYFEQRKRQQQQQQQTSGLESYADGMNICDKHHKEHRSLDILSLLNLSTIAQACKSTCLDGKEDSKVNASTVNCHIGKYPPTVLIHTITAADTVEVKETGIPSGCQEETVSPKKVLFSAPDSNDNPCNGDGDKVDYWETTDHPLSVLDLLGDDGQNGHTEGNPVHEAHVSFSVEGLGKVGTETPVHSPQQRSRLSSYGCSPLKAAKRLHSSKNLHYVHDDLEFEVDAMMQDINMPHGDSSTELPSYSRGIMNSVCNPKPKLSPFEDCTQLYGHSSKIQNSFGDGKIFIDIEDDKDNICKAGSSFLDDNFFVKREYGTSWKNWPSHMEGNSMDLFKFGNHEMLNFDFEGPYPLKKRFTKKPTDGFKGLESPAPYYWHQASENDHEFVTSYRPRYPTVGRNFDFGGTTNLPNWSCFATEDARDSLSLLSEESCSSSAVRGRATQNSPSNSTGRQSMGRHGNDFCGPEYDMKNIYAKEIQSRNRDEIRPGENKNGSGKSTRMSNQSRSKPSHHSNSTFLKKLEPDNSWLFEERCPSVEINSGFSSFCPTSETNWACSGCKLWAEDPLGAFPVHKLHINTESSPQRSKDDVPVECSRSGSFFFEKLGFCQPFNRKDSNDSPIFSNVGFGPTKPDLSPDSEMEGIHLSSSHVGGFHGDTVFPDLSVQESVSRDGYNESKIQPNDFQTLELEKENCIGNNEISSENEKAVDASDSKDNGSEYREAKDETPKPLVSLKMAFSPEHAEETSSSSVKIPVKSGSIVDEKEYHHDAQISLLCQNGSKEIEDAVPEERKIINEEQNNCVSPSRQVMMLESYVLQLLCVQKVLKEASAQDAMKKCE